MGDDSQDWILVDLRPRGATFEDAMRVLVTVPLADALRNGLQTKVGRGTTHTVGYQEWYITWLGVDCELAVWGGPLTENPDDVPKITIADLVANRG